MTTSERRPGLSSPRVPWSGPAARPGFRALRWVLVIALFVALPFALASSYYLFLVDSALIYALAGIGTIVLFSSIGQLSFASAGLFGVGGFAAAFLSVQWHWDYLLAIAGAAVVSLVVGAIVAIPFLRLRGIYLSIGTLAFVLFMQELYTEWGISRQQDGFDLVPQIFGRLIGGNVDFYWLSVIPLFILAAVVTRLLQGRAGRAFHAVRDSEIAAAASGVRVAAATVGASCIAAVTAGVAGAVYGAFQGYVEPEMFGLGLMLIMTTMAVVGGGRPFLGAIIGAAVVTFLPYWLQQVPGFSADAQQGVYGALLVGILLFMPGGLSTLIDRTAAARRRRVAVAPAGPALPAELTVPELTVPGELTVPRADGARPGGAGLRDAAAGGGPPGGAGRRPVGTGGVGVLRRQRRGQQGLAQRRAARDPGPDRRQRGRQEHAAELHQRRAAARQRGDLGGNSQPVPARRLGPGPARHLPHLPARRAVQGPDRVRERPGRQQRQPAGRARALARGRRPVDRRRGRRPGRVPAAAGHAEHPRVRGSAGHLRSPRRAAADRPGPGAGLPSLAAAAGRAGGRPGRRDCEFMAELIRELRREAGVSIVLVEHNMPFVMSLCDRLVVLDFGVTIAEGPPEDIRNNPDVLAAYLGPSVVHRSQLDG